MSFIKFIKTKLKLDPEIADVSTAIVKIQDNISKSLDFFIDKTQLDSTILPGVVLSNTGINYVPHNLGRTLTDYQILQTSDYCVINSWQNSTIAVSPELYLYIQASDPVTADILVW